MTPAAVTPEEQCLAIGRLVLDAQCDPDRYPDWPGQVPPFTMVVDRGWVTPGGTALLPGPHGLLLIRRTPTTEAPETRYDVVDRSGALRGAILMPDGASVVGFGRSVGLRRAEGRDGPADPEPASVAGAVRKWLRQV